MSGTRKMGKFELEAYVAATSDPAPDSSEPAPDSFEPGEAPIDLGLARVDSHPPVRPPSASNPGARDEPSVVLKAPPTAGDAEALRTRLARRFVSLADDVTEAFGDFTIGAGAWGVELTAPTGMSTGGGKQALQPIRLRPRRTGYPVIVGGHVNPVAKRAELRDYAHVTMMHEVRFRRAIEISAHEWEQFLRKAEVVLTTADLTCQRVGPTKELIAQRKKLTRVSKVAAAVLVVVLVLAAIVLWQIFASST